MAGRKRQTFDKMNRERAVREKRARKAEKKEQKKLDAIAAANGDVVTEDGDADVSGESTEQEPAEQQTA